MVGRRERAPYSYPYGYNYLVRTYDVRTGTAAWEDEEYSGALFGQNDGAYAVAAFGGRFFAVEFLGAKKYDPDYRGDVIVKSYDGQ